MITYLGYATIFFLYLHAVFLGIAGTIIQRMEPAPFKMSKVGAAFLIIIISAGFYKFNQIALFLLLTPFGGNINDFVNATEILFPLVLFQTIGFLVYAEARLSLEARWEEKKLRDLQREVQAHSLKSAQKQDEVEIWKVNSEALRTELESVKNANSKAHADYGDLLLQKNALQDEVAFLERSATPQTIAALGEMREGKKPVDF
jgi:hypothetical protein